MTAPACAPISWPARTAAASGFSMTSRRCDRRPRPRSARAPTCSSRRRRPRPVRHERSHAVAAGTAGWRESAAGRDHRLLSALGGGRGEAGVSECRRQGDSHVLEQRSGANPDPATDPVAYNKICQQTPTAPDCGLPLYWPAPPDVLKPARACIASRGTCTMNRFRRRRRGAAAVEAQRRGSASYLSGRERRPGSPPGPTRCA